MELIAHFTIPYPPTKKGKAAFCRKYGLNAYYAGKPWPVRSREAKDLHLLTELAMRKAGVQKRMVTGPVAVSFRWDDGLDIDNHAVLGKAIVDAMKGWLLPNDSPRWVRRVSHSYWNHGCIGVWVEEFREE